MTINSRVARSLRELRGRLRDLAAAEHGDAQSKAAAAASHVADQEAQLEDTLDEAEDVLATATTVHTLDHVGNLVGSHRAAITDAVAMHSAATQISDLAHARLRARIRQLKTAERVVELIDRDRTTLEKRTEQRGHDDLNSSRRR
jgi:flagellar biosynthesis chaperone FliJ